MLYTRTGDEGMSGLFGTSERFSKGSPIYEALGAVDELNSLLGVCRADAHRLPAGSVDVAKALMQAQECLFVVQAELAGADKFLTPGQTETLEAMIERLENALPCRRGFVISGATHFSALCDLARAVARRAERAVARAEEMRSISPATRAYLNRLSGFLYALARYAAAVEGTPERSPSY
jgi:cob(I)alamin adenosyltransferase